MFNLKTPGRETEQPMADRASTGDTDRGRAFIAALGGAANLVSVDACTTRLRLVLADDGKVNVDMLKQLGARGIVRPTRNAMQVVLGPIADQVASDIRARCHEEAAPEANARRIEVGSAEELLAAFGGKDNVRGVDTGTGRALVTLVDDAAIDEPALRRLTPRGVARTSRGSLQLLLGHNARAICTSLRTLIGLAAADHL